MLRIQNFVRTKIGNLHQIIFFARSATNECFRLFREKNISVRLESTEWTERCRFLVLALLNISDFG